jgi:hypothetical protein
MVQQFRLLQQRRVATVYPDGIIPETDNKMPLPAPCVEAIEAVGLTEWGFAIFRTTYGDDEQWAEFQKRFDAMIQEQLDESNGAGIEAVRDDLRLQWVEDPEKLDGAGIENVRRQVESNFVDALNLAQVCRGDPSLLTPLPTTQIFQRNAITARIPRVSSSKHVPNGGFWLRLLCPRLHSTSVS